MSVKLPVARCGVDGCSQKVAWLRLREPDDPPAPKNEPPDWWPDMPAPRWERFGHVIPQMRMNDDEGVELVRGYVGEGWLVGWCRREHGPRWVTVKELEDALDSGRSVVWAQGEPEPS